MNIEIKGEWLGKVFLFNSMLTPKIITFVYWLALIACLVGGIVAMGQRTPGVWGGIAIMVGGPILVRILCELLIVVFKIEEHLRKSRSEDQDLKDT